MRAVWLVEVAHDLGGVHAQVQASAELQLAVRVDGITQGDVREALWERRQLVIHEGAGLVKVAVTGLVRSGAGSLTADRERAEVLQSSIRSRGADQSVVRCSGAQSSGRPSWVSEAMTNSELA